MATRVVAGIGGAGFWGLPGSPIRATTLAKNPPPPLKLRVQIPSAKTLGYGQIKSIHL
jgi:hypothetical protein